MQDQVEQAFLEAYDQHADDLYRFVYFRVWSESRAEELTQEIFLKTWEYLRRGKRVDNLKAFLYRTARNIVIDEHRKKKDESLDGMLAANPGAEPSVDGQRAMEQGALAGQVRAAFGLLPPDLREVAVLRFVSGLEPREIAVITGLTANNVSVRLNRAVVALRGHIT